MRQEQVLRASTIGMLLANREYLLHNNIDAMLIGRLIHRAFYNGKDNGRRLSKMVNGFKIVGHPDSLDNKTVEELKTHNGISRLNALEHGKIQANIYCFLGGYKKFRVRLFDLSTLTSETFEYEADTMKATADIFLGIKLYQRLEKLIKTTSIK